MRNIDIQKILKVLFMISVLVMVFLFPLRNKLPKEFNSSKYTLLEPLQKNTKKNDFKIEKDGITIKINPVANYSISGLVVEDYDSDNFLDYTHKNDPFNTKDLCLVWGNNLNSELLEKIKFSHGEFTCFYKAEDKETFNKFKYNEFSNNHIIPANKKIAKLVKKTKIGDQVFIRGYLANYSINVNEQEYKRKTSIHRTDRGNGACEIIYVNDYKIIKEGNFVIRRIHYIAKILAFSSLCAILAISFLKSYTRSSSLR